MTLATDRVNRDHLAREDALLQKVNSLESQVIVWIAEATALHTSVSGAGDKAQVLAMKNDLVARLTAAVS